jgi:hypothetical protein
MTLQVSASIWFRTHCKTEVRITLLASKFICFEPPCYSTCSVFLPIHKIISIYQLSESTPRRLVAVLKVWCNNNIEVWAMQGIHIRGTFQETSQRHLAIINHKETVSCCQKQRPLRKGTKYIEQQREIISSSSIVLNLMGTEDRATRRPL